MSFTYRNFATKISFKKLFVVRFDMGMENVFQDGGWLVSDHPRQEDIEPSWPPTPDKCIDSVRVHCTDCT